MDMIGVYQIEFHGHCGVTKEERTAGQRLSVDVECQCDLQKVAHSDALADTIDYDLMVSQILKIGRETHASLLETVAEMIVRKILEDERITSVRVRLKKIAPPREEVRGGVVVEIERRKTSPC